MKNASLILSIISLIAAITFGTLYLVENTDKQTVTSNENAEITACSGDIVYIDLDRIIMGYDMANDLRSVVEAKVQKIQEEVQRRGKKLEKDINAWQEKLNKGLMTRSVAEAQQAKLQKQQEEFAQYASQKEQEVQEEQIVMMNQIGDAIKTFLDKYNVEKEYAMIITNNGGAPVITADPGLDITEDVLARLNEEYVASKNANN
ncbi:MAG: OmpH family outer membrane protein [Bacteroidales bacterium]|nr:OmpH family outer membrane protein [Bacteroidales bacterium]